MRRIHVAYHRASKSTIKKMPSSSKTEPPKKCPGCGQSIWLKWDNVPTSPWQRYNTHVQSNHSDFEKWSRRSGFTYFLAVVPFFAFALSATMATSSSEASFLAIMMFPSMFAVIFIVWFYHRRLKNGFRHEWQNHIGIAGPNQVGSN